MISVCDPISRRFSHEKINGGFLAALGEAFPDEAIRVHADPTHVAALQDILAHDGVRLPGLEFVPGAFADTRTLAGMLGCRAHLARVLRDVARTGGDHVLFLAYNPVLLWQLKRLHAQREFRHFRFTFVLHGEFEEIAGDRPRGAAPATGPSKVRSKRSLAAKLRSLRPARLPAEALASIRRRASAAWTSLLTRMQKRYLSVPWILRWGHSDRYRYIALSAHMVANARRYIDVDGLNVEVVTMPIVFAPVRQAPMNERPCFATFGYGDAGMLQEVLRALEDRQLPAGSYELRVIGMDDRGIAGFRNVAAPSQGKPLSRAEMEALASDVDAFLILYRSDKYRLSCSGSIFEAFSYLKPVFYFDTPCVAQFDDARSPIGQGAASVKEFVDNLERVARDYAGFQQQAAEYRRAILDRRESLGFVNSLDALRRAMHR